MEMTIDIQEIESFIDRAEVDVIRTVEKVGEMAVAYNKAHKGYRNVTGNLEASNTYEASREGLVIANTAPYASYVESKGMNVVSEGALVAERTLQDLLQ